MKGFLSWLVHLACRTNTRDFCSSLAALVDPVQNVFSSPYTFQFLCQARLGVLDKPYSAKRAQRSGVAIPARQKTYSLPGRVW
jgi:hypothetical protein